MENGKTEKGVEELIQAFWTNQKQELELLDDFKHTQLPLARIKKVMKSDEDVKNMMISQETPMIFNKVCELFILELTMRSWHETEEYKRKTLQKSDIQDAIPKSDIYDFLIDILPPREEVRMEQHPFFQDNNNLVGLNAEQLLALQQMNQFAYQQMPNEKS
jgi:histone H3/H4